jgi:hypothetical protein
MVDATLNYLAQMPERPAYYFYEPPAGTPWRNTRGDRRRVAVRDARALTPPPSLDREGFTLVQLQSAVTDFAAPGAVHDVYFREVERLVREATGAARVMAFDHNLRNAAVAGRSAGGVQGPVRFAHNDYTERSGPQRVRDLLPDEADELLKRRFAIVQVWRPIRHPVETFPLAICDAKSLSDDNLVISERRYPNRVGQTYAITYNPAHAWYWFPRMRREEAIVFKVYDSLKDGRARWTAHTAFEDPTTPPNARPRESIEIRTLAFF